MISKGIHTNLYFCIIPIGIRVLKRNDEYLFNTWISSPKRKCISAISEFLRNTESREKKIYIKKSLNDWIKSKLNQK